MADNLPSISDIAKQLGSVGGKKSADARLAGKTKDEISATMRALINKRYKK